MTEHLLLFSNQNFLGSSFGPETGYRISWISFVPLIKYRNNTRDN